MAFPHLLLVPVVSLPKGEAEVAHGLAQGLDAHGLGVSECVGLALDTGVVDEGAAVGYESKVRWWFIIVGSEVI